jgi:PAS domain S-box-containing protein
MYFGLPTMARVGGGLSPQGGRVSSLVCAAALSFFLGALRFHAGAANAPLRTVNDDYFIRLWDSSRGLLDPTVRSLAQTADGMIWLGTFGGLGKFDGARIRWESAPPSELRTDNAFVSLHVDHRNSLWAGTTRAILRYDTNGWRAFGPKDGFPGGMVLSIAENAKGEIYFGYTNEVSRWNGSRFDTLPPPPRKAGNGAPGRLAVDADDNLWAVSDTAVSRWDGTRWILEAWNDPEEKFLGLGPCKFGGVWVAANRRIRQRQPGAWGRTLDLPPGFQNDIIVFAEDREGNLICGLFEQGLVIFRADGAVQTATEADGLSHTHIPAVMADRDGSLWLGSGGGGAMQLVPRRFAVLHGNNPRSTENHITAMAEEKDGRVLFASNLGHFFESDGGREIPFEGTAGAGFIRPRAILRDRTGVLWCATADQGLYYLQGGQWRGFDLGAARAVHCLFESLDGDLWAGLGSGYAILGGEGARRSVAYITNLPGPVWQIARAPDGALWMATGAGVYRVGPGDEAAVFQADVAGTNAVSEIAIEPDGVVWAAAEPNLVRFQAGRRVQYGERDGVKLGRTSSLLRDDDGNWWTGDIAGIRRFDRRSLDEVAAGRRPKVQQALYNRNAGLLGDVAWVVSYNGGLRARDGRIWMASRRGLVVFDPRRFPLIPFPPQVTMNSVMTDTLTNELASGQTRIRLPSGTPSFSVEFSTVDPTYGERVTYEFQAGSTNSAWISLGPRNSAHFPSTRPGRYAVRVRAANIDGAISDRPAVLDVEVPPVFWDRGDVKTGLVAALMGVAGSVAWTAQRKRLTQARIRAEEEQARSLVHARFSTVLQSTADLVLFADSAHRITYINDAGRRMLDLPAAEDFASCNVTALLTARSRETWRGAIQDALKAGKPWRGMIEWEGWDGVPIPVAVGIAAHQGQGGTIDFYSIVGHDLREVLGAEIAKREMQEMLELVVDSVPIRLGFVGPDERYRWVSREVERARGIPTDQMVGKTIGEVWGEQTYLAIRSPLHRALAGEQQRFELSFELLGAMRHHEISLLPHYNRSGEIRGVLVVVVDITALKNAAERRREIEGQLQSRRKLEALGTLAGGVAHDFNSLLSVIVGNLNLARLGGPLPVEASNALNEIEGASRRARELVRQILLFCRRDAQRREAIDIIPVVKEAIKFLGPALPENARIVTEILECPKILADPTQIHQVVLNIINNAAQSLQSGPGTIQVSVAPVEVSDEMATRIPGLRAGSHVSLVVKDNGVGMDETTLQRIFEPFFTTKPVGQGTGLGLAVVHGIVEAHGGVIQVASEPGQGSAFSLYFPTIESAPLVPAASSADPGIIKEPGQRILLVDDELSVLGLGQALLSRLGYSVESFSDPAAALARFASSPDGWAGVLTDFTMPAINGIKLSKRISEIRPGLPIILASGMVSALDEAEMRAAGIVRVLGKPYSMTELAVVLSEVVVAKIQR